MKDYDKGAVNYLREAVRNYKYLSSCIKSGFNRPILIKFLEGITKISEREIEYHEKKR